MINEKMCTNILETRNRKIKVVSTEKYLHMQCSTFENTPVTVFGEPEVLSMVENDDMTPSGVKVIT